MVMLVILKDGAHVGPRLIDVNWEQVWCMWSKPIEPLCSDEKCQDIQFAVGEHNISDVASHPTGSLV